ncbi:MAG: hypothetical protein AAGL24_07580 [Pseudomonadota bacterium]
MNKTSRLTAVLALSLLLPVSGAVAFEPTGNAIADRFLELTEASGTKDLSYGSVTESSDGVSLQALVGTMTDEDETFTVKIADIRLVNGSINADDALTVGTLDLSGFSLSSKEFAFTAERLVSEDVVFPTLEQVKSNPSAYNSTSAYSSAVLTSAAFATEKGLYLPIDEVRLSNSDFVGNMPKISETRITNVALTTENLPSGDFRKSLTDLGYTAIRFDVAADWRWDDTTGTFEMPQILITGSEVGDMNWRFRLGGFTPELITDLKALNPADEAKAQEVMGKLQATSIEAISVDFTNKSIVDRVLDQQSQKAGVPRSDFVDRTMASLVGPMAALRNQAFQDMIETQLRAFLTNPKNLKLSVAPANPVPIAQIVGMAAIAPQTIPDILGVSIEAGQ